MKFNEEQKIQLRKNVDGFLDDISQIRPGLFGALSKITEEHLLFTRELNERFIDNFEHIYN